ncbi:MAG: hypothetical protein ABEI58_02605 [Candidatus Nanohaloarchaea archaeon]
MELEKLLLPFLALLLVASAGAHGEEKGAHHNDTVSGDTGPSGGSGMDDASRYVGEYPSWLLAGVVVEILVVAVSGFLAGRHYYRTN